MGIARTDAHVVLLVGNFFSAMGGSRGPIEDLHDALVQAGLRVHYASSSSSRLHRLVDIIRTIHVHSRDADIAVVDVYSGTAFLTALVAALMLRIHRVPYMLTLHGGNLPAFQQRYSGLVDFVLRHAVRITCPSQYLARAFRSYSRKLTIIQNPIRVAEYMGQPATDGPQRILWLRAFHDTYNPLMAVRMFARLRSSMPEVAMTMAGPDKKDGSLERCTVLARELGVEKALMFRGGIPKADVPNLILQHSIFVNTTHVDNLPVTLIEAMASGLLVVSTDVGGVPDLMTHGVHGLLVPDDDAEAMADAILDVVHDPHRTSALRHSARLHAARFDIEPISKQWLQLFDDVIAEVE